jgi:hypothetical protein
MYALLMRSNQLHSNMHGRHGSIEEFLTKKGNMSRNLFDKFSEQLLINHNMYVYHRAAIEACDLVFDAGDTSRIPNEIVINLGFIESRLS